MMTLSTNKATLNLIVASFTAGVAVSSIVFWITHKRKEEILEEEDPLTEDDLVLQHETIDKQLPEAEDEDEDCIYLDYNGTTPVYPEVLEAMLPYLKSHYGNPSSSHAFGKHPRQAVDRARRQILVHLLGASDQELLSSIWFTSCGTESDNLAIQIALQSCKDQLPNGKKPHIVTCNVEHPAIALYLDSLVDQGVATVARVPVDQAGSVDPYDVIQAIRSNPNTVLVTLMLANNESGVLQPVKQVAEHCRKVGVLMHTDAAQAAGKVSCTLEDLGYPDMISLVGHKIGAPKGVACLYVRPDCWQQEGRSLSHRQQSGILLIGGGQEFGRRGGTENVASIVGMGQAAEYCGTNLAQNAKHMERMRLRLLRQLQTALGRQNVRDNGPSDKTQRLPNTLSVGIKGVHSGDLLASVGHLVAASAGATCHSATGSYSAVLMAMKVPPEYARGTLRLSLGPHSTASDMDRAAYILATHAKRQLAKKQQQNGK